VLTWCRRLSLLTAVALAVGETVVAVKYGKYWPLSADDYAVAALLVAGWHVTREARNRVFLVVPWALLAGNMWATLFTRMDPVHGSGDRLGLVAFVLGTAALGLAMAWAAAREPAGT